jgi:hypothetical protein
MSTTIVPKDEQDASVLAEVPPPPCECFNELMPQPNGVIGKSTKRCCRATDPPPLKWSDLRYVFDIKEDRNGKEAIQA